MFKLSYYLDNTFSVHNLDLNKIFGTCTPSVIDGVFPDWVWRDAEGKLLEYNGTSLPSCSKYRGQYRVMPVSNVISSLTLYYQLDIKYAWLLAGDIKMVSEETKFVIRPPTSGAVEPSKALL